MSKTNKLIPEFRFPEFENEGEWTFEELEQCLDYLQPTPYLVESTDYKYEYEIPVLTAGKTFILGYTNEKEGVFRENLPVIIFDDFTTASQFVDFPFKTKSSAMKILLPKNGKNIKFVYEAIQKLNYEVGVHQRHWISIFSKLKIAIPRNPKEQQKIASCLSSLDEVIAAHSQKLELLKDHKKGLMQNLFPQEGEKVPKYRFKEFENDGEWVEKKLGEMTVKVGSGVTPLGGETNYKKTGRPFVRSQNVSWGVFLLENIALIDESTHQNSINTEIQVEDVLLNITGASIGRSAVANEFVSGGNVNQHVCIIRTEMEILNPFFLNQFLISDFGQKQIDSFQAGGNRQGLNFVQIRSLSIPVPPTIQEQQKIASCLSSLDALITSQVEKIEQLKLHKKGLMQKLFPSMSETGFEGLNDEQDV
jgi:type I restriction enzyme, S subunit